MRTASSFRVMAMALLASAAAYAQSATVVEKTGHGEAAIVKGDEAKAFEEAKQQALRAAVEQAAGVRIEADTVTVNNQLVRDYISANTSGYVKSFDVTSKKADKGVYSVDVKAQVITENLDKDLSAARDLVKKAGSPKVVVVIQEQTLRPNEKVPVNTQTTTKFLEQTLEKDGWKVLDAAGIDKDAKLGSSIGFEGQAKSIGSLTKANYVIYGNVTLAHQDASILGGAMSTAQVGGNPNEPSKQSIFPVSGEYALTMFATDTGEQLARTTGALNMRAIMAATGPGRPSASMSYEQTTFGLLSLARDNMFTDLRKGVIENLRRMYVNGREVTFVVNGLPSLGAVKEFSAAVATLKGVKDVAFENDFRKGTASYRLTYVGPTADLAEAVEASNFKKKKIDVVSVTPSSLEVSIAK